MNRISLYIGLLCLLLSGDPLEAKRANWAHERSELTPAPEVVWGDLDNGFRYALLPRDQKPGQVSLRLVVEVGSLDEKEDERGLAHFVEHMAFRGTRHFEPGELVDFFSKLGMGYGVDVNAFTYHDKTVYHLELPRNEPELVARALLLFRDYADGITFDERHLETERAVIMRERQARGAPSALVMEEGSRFAFEGTLISERNPIGLNSVVQTVDQAQLKSFYQKWYRPDLMTLVVVGDFAPEAFEEQITTAFSSLQKQRGRVSSRKMGRLKRGKEPRLGSYAVSGVERHTLQMSRVWTERAGRDSWALRRTDALRSFATALFNERCRRAVDEVSNDFATYDRVLGFPHCQLSISSGGELSIDGFVWMDRLLRQALETGFTQGELDFVRKNWRQINRSNLAHYESAGPRELVDELVDHVVRDQVYVGAAVEGAWMEALLDELTLEEVNEAFSKTWKLDEMDYFVAGDFEHPPPQELLATFLKEDRKLKMPPYWFEPPGEFRYSDLGVEGAVVERKSIPEVGASVYRYDNNVRLTFLHTENESDTVRALVRVGAGMLTFDDDNPATHALAMTSLFRSGFGGNDVEDVYGELRGNVTSFFFGLEDHDAFTYRGVASRDGLDEFLKIVAEYLLNPQVEDEAFDLARSKLRQARQMEADGLDEGYRNLYRMLYPGMPRFHSPSLRDLDAVQTQVVRDWLFDPLKRGYLEVIVVGDANEEAVVGLVGQTLGALPERRAEKPEHGETRRLTVKASRGKHRIEYQRGKGESAASVAFWTIQEELTLRESASLHVLSALLEERLRKRVREEMGASYSPNVEYVRLPAYNRLLHIRVDVDCMQDDAEALLDVITTIAEELASRPIDGEELQAAVAPIEEGIHQAWRDNAFLIENVLYGATEYPNLMRDALRYRDGLLSTLTPDEIHAVAKRYLTADAALAVAIVPSLDPKLAEAPEDNRLLEQPAAVAR